MFQVYLRAGNVLRLLPYCIKFGDNKWYKVPHKQANGQSMIGIVVYGPCRVLRETLICYNVVRFSCSAEPERVDIAILWHS